MPNIVPGAIWQPIDVGNRAPRIKGRGAVGHVAVSSSPNLTPSGTPATRGADWHFYLPKVGNRDGSARFFQYIDLDVQCWATMEGNPTLPAWESEGGLGSESQVNAEPWTENQLQAAAIIYAHLNRTEGAPLQVMPNSRPTSRGLGAHRFGIDPWRVSGGEMWSGPGKLCPGSAKVAQLPEIIRRAQAINHPPTDWFATVDEKTLRSIIADELDAKFDDPHRSDTFGNRLVALLQNPNATSGIYATVKAILGAVIPPAPPAS